MNALLVTTSAKGSSRTRVWETHEPLSLGHPLRWVLERSESGVRIRDLSQPLDRISAQGCTEVRNEEIEQGKEVILTPISFQIRPLNSAPAAFLAGQGAHHLCFHCIGPWAVDSRLLGKDAAFEAGAEKAFRLRAADQGFTLEAFTDLEIVRAGGAAVAKIKTGEQSRFNRQDLADLVFRAGPHSWRFALANGADPAAFDRLPEASLDTEALWFRKAVRATALGFGAFMLLTFIWPKSKQDATELIPAQYTKIILAQPKKSAPAAAAAASQVASSAPKAAQEAAVVQAFRAKALNNAVNGLLKGGMAKLLAQSDVVMGSKNRDEARRMFDTKNDSLKPTALDNGLMNARNVKVASLGGEAGTGGPGGGVGYGKGAHAGVSGQGKSFVPYVSDDRAGSQVEEGLTKDEVGEVIHRHLSEVRYCYESAMIRTPDLEGKLMTRFVIAGNGTVKSTEVASSTLPDPRLDDCILRRLATWKFPIPRGGIDVAVSYPFVFKTLGR